MIRGPKGKEKVVDIVVWGGARGGGCRVGGWVTVDAGGGGEGSVAVARGGSHADPWSWKDEGAIRYCPIVLAAGLDGD